MSKFGRLIKTPFGQIRRLRQKKPVAASCLVIGAVLLCLMILAGNISDLGYRHQNAVSWSDWKLTPQYILWDTVKSATGQLSVLTFLFAAGAFFVESALPRLKKGRKALTLIPFFLLSAFLTCAAFGGDVLIAPEFFKALQGSRAICGIYAYVFVLLLLSICFCFRRTGKSFSEYCLGVFSECVVCEAVFAVIAIGMGLLTFMLCELLWKDADEYMGIAYILAGILYPVATALNALDGGEDAPKLIRNAVRYVLLSLCAVGYVIIYVYIAKIVITWTFPSNSVFSILSGLFAVSMPVALMSRDDAKRDLPHRVAGLMPALFLPFIAVQGLCLGMRIAQYGLLTLSRYLGAALMVFELAYILWTFIRRDRLQNVLPVLAGMLVICLCLPGVCCLDLPEYLQNRTLISAEVGEIENYDPNRISRIRTALKLINCKTVGARREYLEEHFDEAGRENVEALTEYFEEHGEDIAPERTVTTHNAYISPFYELSVEGFGSICRFGFELSGNGEEIDIRRVPIKCTRYGSEISDTDDLPEAPSLRVNLRPLIETLQAAEPDESGNVPLNDPLKLPDGSEIRFDFFRYKTQDESGAVTYVRGTGYLLMPKEAE